MNIQCGENRRIRSYKYGWMIEKFVENKKGVRVWKEDRPAYPPNLSVALQNVQERILKESPDIDITGLTDALKSAHRVVEFYAEKAGALA